MIINEIVWLDSIIEKIMWKHNVMPLEVEETVEGKIKYIELKKVLK